MKKLLLLATALAFMASPALAQSYTTTVQKTQDTLTIASGGTFNAAAGSTVKLLDSTALTATTAEINRWSDVSTRVVALAVDTTLTEATHEGKMLVMGGAGSSRTFTLPAATGGGAVYTFVVGAVNTSNYVITKAGSDTMNGSLLYASDNASNAALAFEASGGTITLNGTTKGGAAIGDIVILRDCASTKWCVSGQVTETGSETTPFS
jgi:hypothetical protein